MDILNDMGATGGNDALFKSQGLPKRCGGDELTMKACKADLSTLPAANPYFSKVPVVKILCLPLPQSSVKNMSIHSTLRCPGPVMRPHSKCLLLMARQSRPYLALATITAAEPPPTVLGSCSNANGQPVTSPKHSYLMTESSNPATATQP